MGTTCWDRRQQSASEYIKEVLAPNPGSEYPGYEILAKARGGSYDIGATSHWYALRPLDGRPDFIMQAIVHDGSQVCVKFVSEDMGPADIDVPDKILAAVPNDPGDSEYGTEWRARVAARKAEFPLMIKDLEDWDIGRKIRLPDGKVVTYAGAGSNGRYRSKVVKTYRTQDGNRYRWTRADERLGRYARVVEEALMV